jgi:hypothetical protein
MSKEHALPTVTGRRQVMRSLETSGGDLPGAGLCQTLAQNQKETNDG